MDRTQIALQNREILTPILEQVARRLSATPINPQNISGATQPELPTINNFTENRARQNIRASSMATEDFLRRAEQGEQITRQDLTALEARQTRGILDFLKRGEEREERGRELLEESGISQLREQQAQFANELAAEQRAFEIERRLLLENPEGIGTTALQGRIAQAERFSLQKQADLAILANASANNLQVARENIQDRLDIEFGDLDAQLDNYKIQVQAVQGLSDTIKRDLIEQAEQEADAQKEQRALKEQLLDTAARIAQTNPALAREMVNMTMGEVTFESVQNIQGKAITSGALAKPVAGGKSLDILDVQRYKEQYPELSNRFVPGMSEMAANQIIAGELEISNQAQIEASIDMLVDEGFSKEEIISQINELGLGQDAIDYANSLNIKEPVKKTTDEKAKGAGRKVLEGAAAFDTFVRSDIPKAAKSAVSGTKAFFSGLFGM